MNKKIALFLLAAAAIPGPAAIADYDVPSYTEGVERMSRRDFDGAILSFNQVIGANSRNAMGYFKRGQCFYYLKNMKLALDDFSSAISVDPKNAEFFLWRGATYCKTSDNPHSIMDYEDALRLDPSLLESASKATPQDASAAAKGPQNEQSVQNYLEAAKIVSENRKADFVAGTVFGGMVRPEFPEDLKTPFMRPAGINRILADTKGTILSCRKSLETNPREAAVRFNYALALQQEKKYQKAVDEFGEAIGQETSNSQYLLARAFCYHQMNLETQAKADLDRARLIDPAVPASLAFK